MKLTRITVAGAAALGILLVSGCGSSGTHEVTVNGTGEVRGTPDLLRADIGADATAPDVSAAVTQVNGKAQAIIDAVVGAGVKREDVQTSKLSINPQYSSPGTGGGTSTISGYKAQNSLRIVVRDLSKASGVLDKAIQAGGNNTRLSGVTFDMADDSKLLADARERAFKDAKTHAEQYAKLSGLGLGDVVTISESHGSTPLNDGAEAKMAAVPVEPGSQTVKFTVTVKWALD